MNDSGRSDSNARNATRVQWIRWYGATRLRNSPFLLAGISAAALAAGMGPAKADCTLTTAPNIYTCSGSTTTGQNILNVDNITVSTAPGFELDATTVNFGSAGLHLWGDGIITYTDVNGSTIDTTGALPNDDANALRIVIGEDAGANLGSAIIRSNGDFIANGDAVYISGQGGLPENGVIDAVFTGDITSLGAFNSGLTFFTPGQGATVSVNNVTGAYGITASFAVRATMKRLPSRT